MNKKSKRLFSLLLALVMILTAIPITALPAFAESKEMSLESFGVCKSHSGTWDDRLDEGSKTATVIWDSHGSGNQKYSIAFWIYDISGIPQNAEIQSSNVATEITSYFRNNQSGKSLEFYWLPYSTYYNDSYITSSTSASGTEYTSLGFVSNSESNIANFRTNFRNRYIDCTNRPQGKLLFSLSQTTPRTEHKDITSILSQAVASGEKKFIIATIQSSPFTERLSDNSDYLWSDAKVKAPTITVDYQEHQDPLVNTGNVDETTAGRVNIGNVIYTSASDNTKNYGTHISETDPYSTPITCNGGWSPEKVEVVDDNGNTITQIYISNAGKLSGDMSNTQFRVENNTDVTANLKFTFSDNKVEYHRVAVKSVPVEAHIALTAQQNKSWGNFDETSFETSFKGSYGSVTGSNHPGNWKYHNAIPNQDTTLGKAWENMQTADKQAGFGDFAEKANCPTSATVVARYYIDISNPDLANGKLYNKSTQKYTIPIPIVRWFRGTSTTNGTAEMVAVTQLSGLNLPSFKLSNTSGETFNATYVGSSSINTDATNANFEIRIKNCDYSIIPKANLSVNLFDKSETRTPYNTAVKTITNATDYTRTAYTNYLNALLEAEAYLSNFEETDTSITTYKNNLTAAYNKINSEEGLIGDVNEIIKAANTAYATLNGAGHLNYTTSTRQTLENVLSSLTYVQQSGSTFTSKVTQPREFSLAMQKDDIERITDAVNALKEAADFTALDEAYNNADALLTGLNNQDAVYTSTSVNKLISELTQAEPYVEFSADQRADTPKEINQDNIDKVKKNIADANTALETTKPTVDLSVYNAMKENVAKVDKDVYNLTADDINKINTTLDSIKTTVLYTNKANEKITISVYKDNLDQDGVNNVIAEVMSTMNSKIAVYNLTVNNATSSLVSNEKVPYGTQVTFTAIDNNADTAWYMSYTSNTTNRSNQYQGTGATYTTNVFGAITIDAHSRTDSTPNKVTIIRQYTGTSQASATALVDFVGSSYTLPAPTAAAGYTFKDYTVNGESKNAGDTVTITDDTVITANYEYNGTQYTVSIDGASNSYNYNDKIQLKAADGKVWVQDLGNGKSRLFYNGSSTTLFVTGDMTLTSVDKSALTDSDNASPVYLSNATVAEGKLVFNGQVAVPEGATVKEFGVLIGRGKAGLFSESDVKVENAGDGNSNYKIMRCKSTKTYGSDQFTIRVSGLAEKSGVIYKGYIIYQDGDKLITTYTDAMYYN